LTATTRRAACPGHLPPLASLCLLLASASLLRADSLETQHALDATIPLSSRFELLLHSRIRTQPAGLGFYQMRAGPILTWDATSRVALLGGYYFARQQRAIDRDFIGGHRLFGGAEFDVAQSRRLAFDQRVILERFLSDAAPDFNRYRVRSRLTFKALLSPYTSHEFFFDAQGWRGNRHSAGVRWSPLRNVQVDLGYLYEARRAQVGPARHMLLTAIHWKKPPRRADPDP